MRVISGTGAALPDGYYGRLARYRHRIFVERLGWELRAADGAESDQFDSGDTRYVMVEDEDGNIAGCARLLPTTRPYLLSEVFPQLLNGLPPPRDPTVWELSRFAAVDVQARTSAPLASFSNSVTALLMREAMKYAALQGALRLITVSPLGIERLIRRLGIRAHRAGPPMIIDGRAIFACWVEL